MIDIGGPALLRAAAKNFAHVAPVPRPDLYGARARRAAPSTASCRSRRAASSPSRRSPSTAAYEASIAQWFGERSSVPAVADPVVREGARPPVRREPAPARRLLRRGRSRGGTCSRTSTSSHGRELSFNNLNDLDAARRVAREFALPACVIVKHANPCGVAVAATVEEAYERALASDPVSAYGGVVVLTRPVSAGARRADRGAVRRGAARARLRRRRAGGADEEAGDAHPRRPRAPRGHAGRARLPARRRRPARPGPRRRRRRPRRDAGRLRRADRGAVGRRHVRVAGLQARDVERDRAREGPADDRHRRRPDEPRRLRPDRARPRARSRATTRSARRSRRTRSSRSRTGPSSRSTRA